MEAGPGRLKSFGNQHRIQRICFFESGDSGRFGRAVRSRRFAFRTGSSAASHSRYDCRRRTSRRRDRAPEVDHQDVAAGAICRRFERLDPDQLALEDVDSDLAREEEKRPPGEKQAGEQPSRRKPLPAICRAKRSASTLRVPAELRVIRTTRPKRLSDLQDGVAGAGARTADRRRPGDARAARPGAGQQVLRPHALVSAVANLRPPRNRSSRFDAGWMGRRSLLVARGVA